MYVGAESLSLSLSLSLSQERERELQRAHTEARLGALQSHRKLRLWLNLDEKRRPGNFAVSRGLFSVLMLVQFATNNP